VYTREKKSRQQASRQTYSMAANRQNGLESAMRNARISDAGKATCFKRGNPGGPGRPKSSPLTDALRTIVNDPREPAVLAWALVLQAKRGNSRAFKEFADRMEGIANQRVELTHQDSAAIQSDDLNAKLRAKLLGD
jgi:hypothetical protein